MTSSRSFANALGIAVDSIRSHPLRTALTLFGIVIGVASVVLVGAAMAHPTAIRCTSKFPCRLTPTH